MPEVGEEMICGVGRVGGLYAGFVINRQGLVGDPEHPGRQRPAGILYRAGIAKISAFSRACNDDGIPLIWLQDISGFDIGREAEAHGLLAYGSSLIYTNSTNTTPMFTVLLRKASGAGYYAMSGLPYDPVVQLSTRYSRLSVMEGRTLAIAAFNTKLDDDFQIMATDPAERAKIEAGMKETEARIERDMDPFVAARQMDTDEIVELGELRAYLAALVEMSVPEHRLPPGQEPADLVDARPPRARRRPAMTPQSTALLATASVVLRARRRGCSGRTVAADHLVAPGDVIGELEVLGRARSHVIAPRVRGLVIALPAEPPLARQPRSTTATMLFDDRSARRCDRRRRHCGRATRRAGVDRPRVPRADERAVLQPAGARQAGVRRARAPSSRPGSTVCLLEVMKTFHRVTYGGATARAVACARCSSPTAPTSTPAIRCSRSTPRTDPQRAVGRLTVGSPTADPLPDPGASGGATFIFTVTSGSVRVGVS